MEKKSKHSKYYGVTRSQKADRWRVQIVINGKRMRAGSFLDERDAAIVYDNIVRENNLDRRLNFPDPEPENTIPNTRLIRLTQGMFAIIDEEYYESVSKYIWYAIKDKNTYYARSYILSNSNRIPIRLHNFIMNSTKMVDHINGNGLDNRRGNLRFCTNMENMQNSKPMRGKSSKYKGVSLFTRYGKFAAQIRVSGVPTVIGYYDDEIDAAIAYDNKAKEVFKEFARLNFPDE